MNKVKLICAITTGDDSLFLKVEKDLEKKFGKIDNRGKIFNFDFTDYYETEMGKNLKKRFIAFQKLILADYLPKIKLFTCSLEKRLAKFCSVNRPVNLDPGYINGAKLVLASTKDYSHRIYLGKGIYGEVTLIYAKGRFQKLPWTYPDYQTSQNQEFFESVRKNYLKYGVKR